MGKGERNRRNRRALADIKSGWAASLTREIEFVGPMKVGSEHFDAYSCGGKGGVLQLVPSIWESMPPSILAAVLARRVTDLTGRCPACDTVTDVASKNRLAHGHEPECPASNDGIRAEMDRLGIEGEDLYSGRRLYDPDPTSPVMTGRKLQVVGPSGEAIEEVVLIGRRRGDADVTGSG